MPTKVCSQCRVTKPLDAFHRRSASSDGHRDCCKECVCRYNADRYAGDRDAVIEREMLRRRSAGVPARRAGRDPANLAAWRLQERCAKYGLTVEDYERMLTDQGGTCAVCGDPPGAKALAIDHDHATGRARALLCVRCNTALGHALDDPARLLALAAYVSQHAGRLVQ